MSRPIDTTSLSIRDYPPTDPVLGQWTGRLIGPETIGVMGLLQCVSGDLILVCRSRAMGPETGEYGW